MLVTPDANYWSFFLIVILLQSYALLSEPASDKCLSNVLKNHNSNDTVPITDWSPIPQLTRLGQSIVCALLPFPTRSLFVSLIPCCGSMDVDWQRLKTLFASLQKMWIHAFFYIICMPATPGAISDHFWGHWLRFVYRMKSLFGRHRIFQSLKIIFSSHSVPIPSQVSWKGQRRPRKQRSDIALIKHRCKWLLI